MVHLDKLHAELKDKGLSVIAITKQDRHAVDTFIEETGAKHPIVIESTNSMRNYGRSSYPSAFLIGANGRILWAGHPGSLQDSVIEEQLTASRLLPPFPTALAGARKALEKDKFMDAYKRVSKALEGSTLNADDHQVAEQIRDWIDWYAKSTVEAAGKDVAAGNVYEAWVAYEEIADTCKGLDVGARAAALAKELKADKAQKLEIEAGRKLDKVRADLADLTPSKAIKALAPLTAKKYAETKAGKQAAEMIAALGQEP